MTGNNLFLSIIIPVYRVEPYLRESLDSIAASGLTYWEAILIDDGSPDGCPQICDEYAARDNRFRVIHQENAGVAAARNAGLDVARGEWVWFVDSDDIVDMRPVGEVVAWLREHEETDLVMFDLESFKDGEPMTLRNDAFAVSDCQLSKNDFLMKHVCYHHQRTEQREALSSLEWPSRDGRGLCLRGLRFTEGVRVAEDLEFQYKYLTLCQHPVKMDTTLYYYRLRESSVTGDAAYRVRAVEGLPIVLDNLAVWSRENSIKPEPWYDYRIRKLLQNLLYSASLVPRLNTKDFQKTVRSIISAYKTLVFPFVKNKKIRLAEWNVRAYFIFNHIYLKLIGLE